MCAFLLSLGVDHSRLLTRSVMEDFKHQLLCLPFYGPAIPKSACMIRFTITSSGWEWQQLRLCPHTTDLQASDQASCWWLVKQYTLYMFLVLFAGV